MTQPVRLALNGAAGRMGSALRQLLIDDRRFVLAHAVVAPDSPQLGLPVCPGDPESPFYSSDWTAAPALDVVVDFSGPQALESALDHCVAQGVALVTGTTGADSHLARRLDTAGERIAVLQAANFSLGVALLTRLLSEAAGVLSGWDLEIVEAHHGRKQDAPSGTALALGRAAATARQTTLEHAAVYSREGQTGPRTSGCIGFAVVRGGDIVGEHTAMLIGEGERLELSHRATDRLIFARGALQSACWLAGRPPGQWRIEDVIAPH